ncbi:MAG: hypothetical protein OXE99_12765 [Cellvibrionales bacterium]|nr:hypothetical protein [Cellvibrionales bacterium]
MGLLHSFSRFLFSDTLSRVKELILVKTEYAHTTFDRIDGFISLVLRCFDACKLDFANGARMGAYSYAAAYGAGRAAQKVKESEYSDKPYQDENYSDFVYRTTGQEVIADIGVGNTINGLGGLGQIGTGVLACSTGLGCVAGIPLIVLGISNVGESATSMMASDSKGFNLVQSALGLSPAQNALLNLTADLAGLNAPAVAKSGWKLFNNVPTDFSSTIKYQSSKAGLILNATSTVNTTVNGFESK